MKFLHAADLHLDTPFSGLSALPAPLQQRLIAAPAAALTKLVDLALAEHVDFVLLVGDLFDQASQSVQAQAQLLTQLERLNTAQIPVVLSFGNHDFQPDTASWPFPANVHAFGAQVETVTLTTAQQEKVAISGFSYDQRWVTTPMIDHYPLKNPTADYHIGMLHGQVGVVGDHYAPFSVSALLSKHYDYWALGHIHQRQALNEQPPVVYPGNIQGRHAGETGAKGCLIVTSDDQRRLTPTFHALTAITWRTWTPDLTGELNRADLLTALTSGMTTQGETGLQLISITLPATLQLTTAAELAWTQGALLAQLQANVDSQHVWPVAIQMASAPDATPLFGLDAAAWEAAGQQVVTSEKIAALADHLITTEFLNTALLEDMSPEAWRAQIMRLLADQYHLTTEGAATDAD
ncbi:metallophosphoesterase family protein [Lactiplantibacillus fabifermentans]|nr:DNA repair exonuclease [Lactiplantibacillus fabifermentans]ETY74435.1 phosphoesterase [Lactiplantibacillus fabifermentans T30PCM01]